MVSSVYEIRSLRPSRRASAYRGLLSRSNFVQDTLGNRLRAKMADPLSERDVEEIVELLTYRCRDATKSKIRSILAYGPIPDRWFCERICYSSTRGWSYCAGQDYPSEIARIRKEICE